MSPPHDELNDLVAEHQVLIRQYGEVQSRCGDALRAQAAEIERLQAREMRLRGALLVRDTALAWARERHELLEASIPGLPRRVALAQRVEALVQRVQDLMRERLHWHRPPAVHAESGEAANVVATQAGPDDLASLEASLRAADLVICQTGCLSHGDYWRVQDHCKRTGKTCVLVTQPEALRIVRIHTRPDTTPVPRETA